MGPLIHVLQGGNIVPLTRISSIDSACKSRPRLHITVAQFGDFDSVESAQLHRIQYDICDSRQVIRSSLFVIDTLVIPALPSWAQGKPRASAIYSDLSNYLYHHGSSSEAAQAIVQHVDFTEDFDDCFNNCAQLWALTFYVAASLSPDDEAHDALSKLHVAISELEGPTKNVSDEFLYHYKVWHDLPVYNFIYANHIHIAPLHPPMSERPGIHRLGRRVSYLPPWKSTTYTVNGKNLTGINALHAKVWGKLPYLACMDDKALATMIDALEEEHDGTALDDLVPSAACWMLYAGEVMRKHDREFKTPCEDGCKRLPDSRGDLWHGRIGFSSERWAFWREGFEAIGTREDVGDGTKNFARRAVEKMDDIAAQIPSGR